jgi:hypothetical protein
MTVVRCIGGVPRLWIGGCSAVEPLVGGDGGLAKLGRKCPVVA